MPSSLTLLFPFIPLSSRLQAISSFISFLLTWLHLQFLFHRLLLGFSSPHLTPSCLSSFLFHSPPLFLPHSSSFTPFVIVPPPLCLRLFYISLSSLLILLFPAFTPLLLSAIIRFSPVFLSKYCHLALPQSFYWGSRWRTGVRTSLYVPAVSSCQLKVQGINIPTLQAFQTNLLPKKSKYLHLFIL